MGTVVGVTTSFSDRELTDLQLLFNLSWCGFGALADDEGLRALRDKGGAFDRADIDYLLGAQRRIGQIAHRHLRNATPALAVAAVAFGVVAVARDALTPAEVLAFAAFFFERGLTAPNALHLVAPAAARFALPAIVCVAVYCFLEGKREEGDFLEGKTEGIRGATRRFANPDA